MKRVVSLFILLLISIYFIKPVNAEVNLASGAKSAVLLEPETGEIVYKKNENTPYSMASMTKVMTLSIIFDNIKNGNLTLETEISTSSHARSMGGSQVYLEEGETHSLDEMLKCICIASANDCAVAVAEKIAGSEASFVEKMNEKAKSLGMNNTLYSDCTGLSDENHYTSALDMAKISSYLIINHPDVLKYTSLREAYFRENTDKKFWLVNTNKLVGKYEGVDGLKTGVFGIYRATK